jgi:hypothetical protein
MSSVKFTPFASALKSAITKINNITSDIDKKVDTFVDEVISKIVDYDEEFFTRGGNEEIDKDDMKASIKDLFKMFQPEKKKSYSGYILYCQEERNNIKIKMSLRKTWFFHHQAKKIRVRVMKFKSQVKNKINKSKCFNPLSVSVKCTLYLLLFLSLIQRSQNLNKK